MINKPKGTKDILGLDAKKWKYVERVVDEVMEKYHYGYIRTPIFEATELFHRGVGEASDIVTKETYDFVDRGNRAMTLRPEGTAGVVRSYIENKMYGDSVQPVKFYYNGPMYRYERPQAGRERELTQFGAELIGSDDAISDAEIISLAVQIYHILGLKDVVVHINSLGDTASRDMYRNALLEYFKPHLDSLCDDCKRRYQKNPLRILDCKVDGNSSLFQNAPKTLDYLNEESKSRFEKVQEYLDILEIPYEVDHKIVRGLDYYNHTVFEFITNIPGMGGAATIGAGGRYNGLIESLGGPSTPGIGFGSGMDRVLLALEQENIEVPVSDDIDLYLLYVNEEEKKYALYLAQELRLNGFTVEMENMGRSLKAQFKQADRLHSKFTIVLNSEELDEDYVTVKNAISKEEEQVSLDALIYYLDENLMDDDTECDCGDCHHHDC